MTGDGDRAAGRWGHVALATAAAVGLFGLLHGLSWSPSEVDRLRDDAFYEFVWAANVATGNGPIVSDGVWTSGVQLLWSALLVLPCRLFGAAALPHLAPWLGLLCHLAAAALIAWRGDGGRSRDRSPRSSPRSSTGSWITVTAALLWVGNPLLVRECQNGQETALALLVLVLLWQERHAAPVRVALLSILAVFARTDLVAFVVAIAALRYFAARPREQFALALPVVALVPLLLVNLALGGGLLPDSAEPMTWLWHSNFAATEPTLGEVLQQQWWFTRPVLLGGPWWLATGAGTALLIVRVLRPEALGWRFKALVLFQIAAFAATLAGSANDHVAYLVIGLGWLACCRAFRRGGPVPEARGPFAAEGTALLLAAAAILVLHWALRWYPRDYYAAPLALLTAVAVVRSASHPVLVLLVAAVQVLPILTLQAEPLAGQRAMALAGRHLAEVLPPGERVGCFNSGLVTFHADVLRRSADDAGARRGVVNLDGVVHSAALAAMQERRLAAELDALGVRFLLDHPRQFALDPTLPHASGRWFGRDFDPDSDLVELARFVRPGADAMRFYWRRDRGAPPAPPAAARDLGRFARGEVALWPARPGETLEIEQQDGGRIELVSVDRATTAVVWIAPELLGTGRLFVRGVAEPLLRLTRL